MRGKRLNGYQPMLLAVIGVCLAITLAACAPGAGGSGSATDAPASNDTVISGDLNRYDPQTAAAEVESGRSMGIDEETELQQEKTTAGAGGTVTSTNIQPMEAGITGYQEDSDPPGFAPTTG